MTINTDNVMQLSRRENFPLGLSAGKMGVCLSLYILARKLDSNKLGADASGLLHDILANTDKIASIDMKHGIMGIGWGLDYLLINKYIDGDINYILKDTDSLVLKSLNPISDTGFDPDLSMDALYYIALRLRNKHLKKDDRFLFQETSIEYINKLSFSIDGPFFEESIPFSIESKIVRFLHILSLYFKLGFYNSRLDRIMQEISYKLLSFLPILHSNKLLLLGAMSLVKEYSREMPWQQHIDRLKKDFDVETVIRQEIRQKNISIANGLAGMVLALEMAKEEFPEPDYSAVKGRLLSHFTLAELENNISEPAENTVSLMYGEMGALTIYEMFAT